MKLCLALILLIVASLPAIGLAQSTKPLQHIWEVQPDFGDLWPRKAVPHIVQFDASALASNQVQERVRLAQLICREHDNPNFVQKERALELLIERLKRGDEPLQARRAMVSAAVLLSDCTLDAFLWELSRADDLMQSTVEKALVKWKSAVALPTWRQRLLDPLAKPADIAIALKGLSAAGNADDSAALQAVLCGHRTTLTNRHLAASALGSLNRAGLNDLAQAVLESDVEQRHLLAALVLKQHHDDRTLTQLRRAITEGSNVAQLIAAQTLVEQFPLTAQELAPLWTEHADNSLRRLALEVLHKASDEASLRSQAKLLSDLNLDIRRLAGSQLVEKAARGQRAIVDECLSEQFSAQAWTGIEQAIIVSANLQDHARCSRLVELLEHPRPEVNMYAGWGLMELAQDAMILSDIQKHVEKMTVKLSEIGINSSITDTDLIRLSFLHEAFGRNRYEPANDMLLKYLPKNDFKLGIVSRASAIWALGQLNIGKDNAQLRAKLCERIEDVPPVQPEDYLVRFVCVLVLGEMGYADVIGTIQKFRCDPHTPLGSACEWALAQIAKLSAQ